MIRRCDGRDYKFEVVEGRARATPVAPRLPLGECTGDCDSDAVCASGLTCFQQSGYTTVPGCCSQGTIGYDHCIAGALPRLDSSAGDVRCRLTSRCPLCGRMSTKELLSRCSTCRTRIPVISSSGFGTTSIAALAMSHHKVEDGLGSCGNSTVIQEMPKRVAECFTAMFRRKLFRRVNFKQHDCWLASALRSRRCSSVWLNEQVA